MSNRISKKLVPFSVDNLFLLFRFHKITTGANSKIVGPCLAGNSLNEIKFQIIHYHSMISAPIVIT